MPTILIVEDEVLFREGVQEVLELHGFVVICAADGQEALALLATVGVDLVITNLAMPNMDGVEFVSRLRDSFPAIPILTISGGSRVVSARFGLDSALLSGANDSLTKPFNAKQLLEKVQKLLEVA